MVIPYSETERNDAVDEYITPPKLIEAVMPILPFKRDATFSVLDPGANLGQWGSVTKTAFPNACVTGVELMDIGKPSAYTYWYNHDFLTWTTNQRFDLVISNPPYSNPHKGIAEEFIRHSFTFTKPGGYLYFLLRTNFGNAKKRARGLFKEYPLKQMLFVDRPYFYKDDPRTKYYGKKKTNTHDYSMYVFQKGVDDPLPIGWILWDGK